MKALRVVFRLGLLIGLELAMPAMPAMAQTTPPKGDQPPAPGLIKLTGDDEKRAKQLDEQIEKCAKADRWDEAIASTADLLALRRGSTGRSTLRPQTRSGSSSASPGGPDANSGSNCLQVGEDHG